MLQKLSQLKGLEKLEKQQQQAIYGGVAGCSEDCKCCLWGRRCVPQYYCYA